MSWWRRAIGQRPMADGATTAAPLMAHTSAQCQRESSRGKSVSCRRCEGTAAIPGPLVPTFSSLSFTTGIPTAAATTVAQCLDLETLAYVAFLTEIPSFRDVFQRRARLTIPPDDARSSHLCLQEAAASQKRLFLLPSQYTVVDTYHLHPLYTALRDHVHALVIDPRRYALWPELPLQCAALASFPQLIHLEISSAYHHRIDLRELARCVPRLEKLMIQNATQLVNCDLYGMDQLHTLHLSNTNIDSFSIAVGLPRLTSLTLDPPLVSRTITLQGGKRLAQIAPLTTLAVRGAMLKSPPRAAYTNHLRTLRSFTYAVTVDRGCLPPWRAMTQLRSLSIRSALCDLRPLVALRQLEYLRLVVAEKARHCRPLRELATLRELHLSHGWICDLVGFLPNLHKLVCHNQVVRDGNIRGRLCRRPEDRTTNSFSSPSRLRQLVLIGHITIDTDDPVVRWWLHGVDQVDGSYCMHSTEPLYRIFPHLKRLATLKYWCSNNPRLDGLAAGLEELFAFPDDSMRLVSGSALDVIAADQLRRMTELRVLACPMSLPFQTVAAWFPNLTHLLTPCDRLHFQFADFSLTTPMIHLRVVSLSPVQSCEPLRRARRNGRTLPSLQHIFHSVADCLWSPVCPHTSYVQCSNCGRPFHGVCHELHSSCPDKVICLLQPAWAHCGWKI